jgi:hypothetical protein
MDVCLLCEISNSHGGEYDVQSCLLGYSLMIEAVRTSETSVDNHFTRQYIPEDNSEHLSVVFFYVVLSCAGRGLCDGLITRPEESYRVSVRVIRKPRKGRPKVRPGL